MPESANLVFSLDPGSQRSGWAVMGPEQKLIEAGLLLPSRTRDDAAERIRAMKQDLLMLLDQYQPDAIVMEWTSGKVVRSRHGGGGAGLPIYGVAVGALWQVCEQWAGRCCLAENPCQVVLIPENEWTAGRPKFGPSKRGRSGPSRVGIIAGMFKEYDREKDPGGDVADAIGLNLYYQRQQWYAAWKNQHPAGPARPRRKGKK